MGLHKATDRLLHLRTDRLLHLRTDHLLHLRTGKCRPSITALQKEILLNKEVTHPGALSLTTVARRPPLSLSLSLSLSP